MADVEEDGLADTLKGLDTSRVVTRIVDVSSQDEVEAMVSAAVERFGRLDVIVNNAGVGVTAPSPRFRWRDAAFVSGVVLSVDGGLNASTGQPDFGRFDPAAASRLRESTAVRLCSSPQG